MIRLTIYAGFSHRPDEADDMPNYEPCTTQRLVSERDLSEELRKIGLEWRQADYFGSRQTVITLDPVPAKADNTQTLIRAAMEALEGTGLA